MIRLLIITAFLISFSDATLNWVQYKSKFSKFYDQTEDIQRQKLFEENLLKIKAHNERFNQGLIGYSLDLNQFSDVPWLDPNQKNLTELYWNTLESFRIPVKPLKDIPAPKTLSWKTLDIPATSQDACDSCFAFAAIGMIEHQLYYFRNENIRLSQQELIDCDNDANNYKCEGGVDFVSLKYVKDHGISYLLTYPYRANEGKCYTSHLTKSRVQISEIYRTETDEENIKNQLYQHGPLSLALSYDLDFRFYNSGIFDSETCVVNPKKPIRHLVTLVGYGTDENGTDFWEIKNSWGENWGLGGYAKIARNKKMCNIGAFPAFFVEFAKSGSSMVVFAWRILVFLLILTFFN